ncbi:MAG: amino acid deaminase [Acidobacteria bacterium]|nr:amino acid deaminase [Acidobacteriota bacterium]MBW4045856.1 amino acid deaminase [Acidobacteriota bacterium]
MQNILPLNKGICSLESPATVEEVVARGLNLLREDLMLPAAVLLSNRLEHNLAWMQRFARASGVQLAPHGKTTMAPALFEKQLKAGAWGITVATAQQARVAAEYGVRRILMANQLVGRQNMTTVSHLLPGCEFFCLVDSAAQVELLGAFFKAQGQRLNVLVELGSDGGRAGVRNQQQLEEVLDALGRWPGSLALCGVEVYEGVLDNEAAVRLFLDEVVETAREIAVSRGFDRSPFLLTGAGSAWYDVVAEVFGAAAKGLKAEIILRPGCYLTHDVGIYRLAQQEIEARSALAAELAPGLQPAMQLWAYVQSIPEPQKAIITLGKRDAAFDAGLPVPTLHCRPGNMQPLPALPGWKLTRMMDQHAYLAIDEEDDLRVGDMIGFDISHPCLTFDKWRWIAVVDENYNVMDMVETYF